MKTAFVLNAKNLIGWRTHRKIVVISVDDYGNVRLDSKAARDRLDKEGLKVNGRFDAYDALENKIDLESLFEVLTSIMDKNGRHPVFSTFAVPCNINYEKMAETDFQDYYYEYLPQTFEKLALQQPAAYEGAWKLMKDGIKQGLIVPLFHGREHLNLKVFKEKLQKRDPEVLFSLRNRSYTSISDSGYSTISPMAAFDFWKFEENDEFNSVIQDGLDAFALVYGYRSDHFNPPGGRENPSIHKILRDCGIKYIDTPFIKNEHQGYGKYRKIFNYTGKRTEYGQTYIVRNVVFEPTENRNVDWVKHTLKQVEAAFRWNRPAIISSHRVNFCGHIDEKNREKGLKTLKLLLHNLVKRWPEVEFMAANELGYLIQNEGK